MGEEDTLGVEDTLGRTPWGRRTPWGGHPGDTQLLDNASLTYKDPSKSNLKSRNESIRFETQGGPLGDEIFFFAPPPRFAACGGFCKRSGVSSGLETHFPLPMFGTRGEGGHFYCSHPLPLDLNMGEP